MEEVCTWGRFRAALDKAEPDTAVQHDEPSSGKCTACTALLFDICAGLGLSGAPASQGLALWESGWCGVCGAGGTPVSCMYLSGSLIWLMWSVI